MASLDMIKESFFVKHRRIIFSGNGYSDEWVEEAEREEPANLKSGIDSVSALITLEKAVHLF